MTFYPIHALSRFPPLYLIRNSEPTVRISRIPSEDSKRVGLLQKAQHKQNKKLLVHVQRMENSQKPKKVKRKAKKFQKPKESPKNPKAKSQKEKSKKSKKKKKQREVGVEKGVL